MSVRRKGNAEYTPTVVTTRGGWTTTVYKRNPAAVPHQKPSQPPTAFPQQKRSRKAGKKTPPPARVNLTEQKVEELRERFTVPSLPRGERTSDHKCVGALEVNLASDSDFYGMYEKDGEYYCVMTGSTAYSGGGIPAVTNDKAAREAYQRWYTAERHLMEEELGELKRRVVDTGSVVLVNRPRSPKHGFSGRVTKVLADRYDRHQLNVRIESEDGSHVFVPMDYVQVRVGGEWVDQVNSAVVRELWNVWYYNHPLPR